MTTATMNARAGVDLLSNGRRTEPATSPPAPGAWLPGYEVRVDLATGRVLVVTPERPHGIAGDDEQLPRVFRDSMLEEAEFQIARLREQIDAA